MMALPRSTRHSVLPLGTRLAFLRRSVGCGNYRLFWGQGHIIGGRGAPSWVITAAWVGGPSGSTSRGGLKALLQLTRTLASGHPAGFTVDGPRGPAGVAQPGAVWLAKATGHPVLPFHLEASRHWTLHSWDRTQIPRPFSTVSIAVGEPFYVPSDADDRLIEEARQHLDRRLQTLEARAREMLR